MVTRKKDIKLSGRLTEKQSSKENMEFVQKKLDQGMSKSEIVRQAIDIYRKHEEGLLYKESLNSIKEMIKSIDTISKKENKTLNDKELKKEMFNTIKDISKGLE